MGLPQATRLLRAAAPPVKIIDVGAMAIGGKESPHVRLVKAGLASLVGFEPVAAECERLNALDPAQQYLPFAVGDGSDAVLRECNFPMTSSLYEPDTALLEKFQALAELTTVVRRIPMQTKRLDDVAEASGAQYLKLDVQGAELDILKGAQRLMSSVLVVHTEVAFVPLYRDQPLFADIDAELRRHGLVFHRFMGISGRAYKPFLKNNNPSDAISQYLWADAVYIRDFMRFGELAPDQLLQLALIVNECYVSFDLAALALRAHDAATGGTLGAQFTAAVTAP
jgi:FkbM family methyltransferase